MHYLTTSDCGIAIDGNGAPIAPTWFDGKAFVAKAYHAACQCGQGGCGQYGETWREASPSFAVTATALDGTTRRWTAQSAQPIGDALLIDDVRYEYADYLHLRVDNHLAVGGAPFKPSRR
jgi:hypothetical protein